MEALLQQYYDNRIAVAGDFRTFDEQSRDRLARIDGGSNAGEGVVGFRAADFVASESSGLAQIHIDRYGGLSGNLSGTLRTFNGTAADPTHYVGTNRSFTLSNGVDILAVPINVIDQFNDPTNGNRVFNLQLTSTNSGSVVTVSNSMVTIRDNDPLLNFALASYSVGEAGGQSSISVTRIGGSADAFSVGFATSDGSAVAGINYTNVSGTLSWTNGESGAKSFSVGIINNALTNGNPFVNLSLFGGTNLTRNEPYALIGRTNAILQIVDDEFGPGLIRFASTGFTVSESGTNALITVIRTNGSIGDTSIDIRTLDGTALGGTHFVQTNQSFQWLAGDDSSRTFIVPLINDGVTNFDRNFTAELFNLGAGGAALGARR